ncbi:MAG: nuclear transport factor 2 family protein [Myxococcota bacterium]
MNPLALWLLTVPSPAAPPDRAEVDRVLDALHQAATDADAERYFGLYADDAVFIGTDASERWDLPAFRAFAAPHFEQAPAWTYTPERRAVSFDRKGRTAWFDEALSHPRYGEVRGSGVLVREGHEWRVAQYVLSFPVPNEVAPQVLGVIRGAGAEARLPRPIPPSSCGRRSPSAR